jgi:hypothetical protein
MYIKNAICFLSIMTLIYTGGYIEAEIYNGSFEYADPNNSSGYSPPTGWNSFNYTNVVNRLDIELISGDSQNWNPNIVENGLEPVDGDHLVLLSTGDVRPDEVNMAKLTQNIRVRPGEQISGVYFFGTCDYLPWDDYAEIILIADPNTMSEPNDIILAKTSISILGEGDYASMGGWEHFEYTFPEQKAGKYELVLSVYDEGDLILNSYLAVDNIRLCKSPREGDINSDCEVDLSDFCFLASDWLKDCSDPNDSCHSDTDLNNNNYVNIEDLNLLINDWLYVPQ